MKKIKTLVIYNLRRKALDESCIDFVISTLCSKRKSRSTHNPLTTMGYFRKGQQEHEHIRKNPIKDLITFIQSLTAYSREIIVCIDTNEPFIQAKSGTARRVELRDLVDPIINKYEI